jgi:hypothetical protein
MNAIYVGSVGISFVVETTYLPKTSTVHHAANANHGHSPEKIGAGLQEIRPALRLQGARNGTVHACSFTTGRFISS